MFLPRRRRGDWVPYLRALGIRNSSDASTGPRVRFCVLPCVNRGPKRIRTRPVPQSWLPATLVIDVMTASRTNGLTARSPRHETYGKARLKLKLIGSSHVVRIDHSTDRFYNGALDQRATTNGSKFPINYYKGGLQIKTAFLSERPTTHWRLPWFVNVHGQWCSSLSGEQCVQRLQLTFNNEHLKSFDGTENLVTYATRIEMKNMRQGLFQQRVQIMSLVFAKRYKMAIDAPAI
ncbi:hypothetical protein EVAR_29680_1 [Eumeta japonica]|uniref:Uncharacterized protein n=1 Tax=Eumeta variegata TaxID=151549 RepID=A0A4C1WAA4_EUMVA|nr:hypothetical protein EVAR_29680_1 [Eumeta japonica]